ncbi:hypothetical protein [Nitrospira sp. KM1]|uniref:hypothetical protein n=1 Tax=Nitrospira sp. KM1 TaxID=1936990 RepID=UPI00156781AC|nr:hypothetical protein [Nitrospira sp. KM1]
MAYFWVGDPLRIPLNRQFDQDKYACLDDYRSLQPVVPPTRDIVTELRMMDVHQHECLASKGWELRPTNASQKTEPQHVPPARRPIASIAKKDAQTTRRDESLQTYLPNFIWAGNPADEPSSERFHSYANTCTQYALDRQQYPEVNPEARYYLTGYMDDLSICLNGYGYRAEPVKSAVR